MAISIIRRVLPRTFFVLLVGLLAGCAEKDAYERAVLQQMQNEKDIKDYKIDPQIMTACVVSETSSRMPGLNAIDPIRRQALKNYTAMLELTKSSEPTKTLEELRTAFGSPQGLADAHAIYAEAVVNCLSNLVSKAEEN
ncbi:MAG: hypothetical protein CTY17_10840 [Methylomonas sp.]|nr:MAG: hypothetical protein CTY23_03025 [Methylomonas sp.]PPD37239.1 MAG: hypothetical protein CTY17_10840 [Methylomonas sp.]PPD54120.1 MAG: hypothetical protein CTY11_04050 [Methylomonas sp.]